MKSGAGQWELSGSVLARGGGLSYAIGYPGGKMNNLNLLEAVIFDMDGVLIDTMPYHARAWQMAFQSAGLEISPQEVYEREGESGPEAVEFFFRKRGLDPVSGQAESLLRKKELIFKEIATRRPFAGVLEFLVALRERRKRLAVVTGTARKELEIALPREIREKFEVIITGDEVKRGKPDPEPYVRALDRLNLVPEKGLVIENAPLGIKSALGAGLRCWAVETSLSCEYLSGAEYCFSSLQTLSNSLLGKIAGF